ncbi:hypothetical protein ACF8PL_25150 [Delftia sp. WSY_4]|uniref:hypothetical protein n=1 Tax=unclassified Delftia TaxID=2613839 RepID=UPI00370C82EA
MVKRSYNFLLLLFLGFCVLILTMLTAEFGPRCLEWMSGIKDLKHDIAFSALSALFGGLAFAGVLVTLEASRRDTEQQRQLESDKEFVNQVRQSYEWAYLALTGGEEGANRPIRNRLAWLTCSRHLLRAKKIKKMIKTDVYSIIQGEYEEFWRHRFFLLTNGTVGLDLLASHSVVTGYEPHIDLASALTIERFASAEDWVDPTLQVDEHSIMASWHESPTRLSKVIESYVNNAMPDVAREQRVYRETSSNKKISQKRFFERLKFCFLNFQKLRGILSR